MCFFYWPKLAWKQNKNGNKVLSKLALLRNTSKKFYSSPYIKTQVLCDISDIPSKSVNKTCKKKKKLDSKIAILRNLQYTDKAFDNFKNQQQKFFDMSNYVYSESVPTDTGQKFNAHKTLRRPPRSLLDVLFTFNLRPVSAGIFNTLYIEIKHKC